MNDKQLLKKAVDTGNQVEEPFNFGAVVADKSGKIIAANHGNVFDGMDASAHAEITAIRSACKVLNNHELKDCTLYSSHEPCIMCVSCAAWAGIDRIVFNKPASQIDPGMYLIDNYNSKDIAERFIKPIKVSQLDLQ